MRERRCYCTAAPPKPKKKKGIKFTDLVSTCFELDVDGTGVPRVLIPAIHPASLLRQDAPGHFEDITAAAGIENLEDVADLTAGMQFITGDRLDGNITGWATQLRDRGVGLRPHTKTSKCPQVIERQVQAGVVGLTVATLGEAEVLAVDFKTGSRVPAGLEAVPPSHLAQMGAYAAALAKVPGARPSRKFPSNASPRIVMRPSNRTSPSLDSTRSVRTSSPFFQRHPVWASLSVSTRNRRVSA